MKFEISNSKLEQVIFKYLDNKDFVIKETYDDYYFLENEGDEDSLIRVKKDGMVCFVYFNLRNEIESFFSINKNRIEYILTKYVENKLNIKVSYTLFRNIGVLSSLRVN